MPEPPESAANTTTTIPAKPTTKPTARSGMIRSPSTSRLVIAAKNGALFNSTDAIAAPASNVPSEIPARVMVTFPSPIAKAHVHPFLVEGNREPITRSTTNMITPAASARTVAINAGEVNRRAALVTG